MPPPRNGPIILDSLRHHLEGIKRVVELFGEEAGKAARQHIINDLKEEGWTEKGRYFF